MIPLPPRSTLFPYTTLFRSLRAGRARLLQPVQSRLARHVRDDRQVDKPDAEVGVRSEEHTSELQSHSDLVCRLLLEKKNTPDQGTFQLPHRVRDAPDPGDRV